MDARVCLIGLDCAVPEFIFDQWVNRLPNLRRIMAAGAYGPLESTIPPITVPAWMCMMTGKDPGSWASTAFVTAAIALTTEWPSPAAGW